MQTLSELVHKTCTKCDQSKPVDCFIKQPDRKSGFTSQCKECRNTNSKKYRSANPEKEVQRSKNYYLKNKEKVNTRGRKYYADNPEKAKAQRRKYSQNNPEKYKNYVNNRRARKLANGVFEISAKELKILYASPCVYCGSLDRVEMDHVIPLSKGGRHSIGNLVPACITCNRSKADKYLAEWLLAIRL